MTRFVHHGDCEIEELSRGTHEWLCKPGLTDAKDLLVIRATMPPGKEHSFHVHPEMEEVIYVLSGTAEQWVDKESTILRCGEMAHIPKGMVHATFNVGTEELVFLAILSPASVDSELLVDVSAQEPWKDLRVCV